VAVESVISLTEMRLYSVSVPTISGLRWMSTALLSYVLIPLLNRILDGDFSCCSGSPVTSGSGAAPQLHLLQLLLPDFSACDYAHAVVLRPHPSLHATKGLVKMY